MSTPTTPPAGHRAVERVGPYRLLTRIGEGGMGVVHLAQGPDGARVALKVLRPHIVGDDEGRERLAREVASLRRVTSPRVAEVIDADPWGETPYVATRYVPGLSLHQHIREEGPLSGTDLRWFAIGLAEAVIAVHSVGVLHRDVKPSNVLLEGRSPVLIDFGLARLAEDPRLTHTGWLLGTPGYLAPEVLYGEDATTASDVHAWAATVVFAATGRPPFGTGPAMAIMDRVRRGEHDLSDVPDDLYPVLWESLAAEPGDRPSTGSVLAAVRAAAARPLPAPVAPEPVDFTWPLAAVPREPDPDPTDRLTAHPSALPSARPIGPVSPRTVPGPGPVPPATTGPGAGAVHPATPATRVSAPPTRVGPPPGVIAPPPTGRADVPPWPAPQSPGLSRTARVQRSLLLGGLFGCAVLGFGAAPYLAFGVAALLVWLVRTQSWTVESAWSRQTERGRRWYDAPLTLLTTPWYLLVATGGTALLLLCCALLTFLAGLLVTVFGLPTGPGVSGVGLVFAVSLWRGPGAARLRRPTHRSVGTVVRRRWAGWAAVSAVAVLLALLAWQVTGSGVTWSPQPGPPWRGDTMIGDVVRQL